MSIYRAYISRTSTQSWSVQRQRPGTVYLASVLDHCCQMKNRIRRAGSKLRGQHKLRVHCTRKCEKLVLEFLLVIHTKERAVRGLVSHSPRLRALGKQDGPVLIRGHHLRSQRCGKLKG